MVLHQDFTGAGDTTAIENGVVIELRIGSINAVARQAEAGWSLMKGSCLSSGMQPV